MLTEGPLGGEEEEEEEPLYQIEQMPEPKFKHNVFRNKHLVLRLVLKCSKYC